MAGLHLQRIVAVASGRVVQRVRQTVTATPEVHRQLGAAASQLKTANIARARAIQHCRKAVQQASNAGMTEVELASIVGVNRLTIRRWLGK